MDRIEIEANGFTFDAFDAGPRDGEPIVLLHGFPQTGWMWRHQIEALAAAGYRAIAPDQRGYSPRARPDEISAYRSTELVSDVLAVADVLDIGRFHLAGHDWGGGVAWQVAARHGDRVRTLTVLSTPHPLALTSALRGERGGDQADRSSYFAVFRQPDAEDAFLADDAAGLRMIYAAAGLPEMEAEPYVRALGSKEALRAALHWYRAADGRSLEGLGAITMPTLYVWSTDDPSLGREAAEATAQHVEGPYEFVVLDGIGHWIAEHAPERVNNLLLAHLTRT